MGRLAKITRRTFLVGAAALVGGFAVGYVAYKRDPKNPLLDDLADGASTLNPFLLIDAQGITVITPRADVGQGAWSVLAALIAEELDLAWGQFKVDPGPPSAAYYNGKVAAEGFPIAATSDSFFARNGRAFGDVVGKLLGLQVTGGSSTVADAFDRLRVAGATARRMLLIAAAKQTGEPIDSLSTRDGQVLTADGRAFSYVALAPAAARLAPPHEVALKPASQWRLLGKPMQRIDMVAKCTGTAHYGIDLRLPGMLHATVCTNPFLGGGIRGFDDGDHRPFRHRITEFHLQLAHHTGVLAGHFHRRLVRLQGDQALILLHRVAHLDQQLDDRNVLVVADIRHAGFVQRRHGPSLGTSRRTPIVKVYRDEANLRDATDVLHS